ncbi:polyprotein [Cucumis melo var. makuwa]|uniref:Polyprotein n=1 Tax=Cucumis melo var. makuwa TaxID=1194695 RepID=A0A5D3CND8_CUCMM|nr:polyprotein [Cucumis melo var. makuwa]TYK13387.1 polyprotein [Cucumis melo var. makuwa]
MQMKDKTALYLMFQAVDESGFEKIIGAKTSKEAWHTLEKAFKGADRVKQAQMVVNQLKHNGDTLKDARVVEKIFLSLTNDFENVVCATEESKNLEEMTTMILQIPLKHMNKERKEKKTTRDPGRGITNKDDHQRRQGNVCTTQSRKRTWLRW